MIVIKGFVGKSLKVQELLERANEGDKILVVDTEGYPIHHLLNKVKATVYGTRIYDLNRDELEEFLEKIKLSISNSHFDAIVFYLNTKEESIDLFKKFEEEMQVTIVLTVQVHADESQNEVEVYDV